MPELPEVETVCAGLRENIKGLKIERVQVFCFKLRKPVDKDIGSRLCGKKITDIKRRAKYILIISDEGDVLIIHLGMSGRLIIEPKGKKQRQKHDRVLFVFDKNYQMVFNDIRKFGLVSITDEKGLLTHKNICKLGPEPLDDNFTDEDLFLILQKKKTSVKKMLMNANFIAGIGNIYACEILFQSSLHPETLCCDITREESKDLYENIKKVLNHAIKAGGSTLKDYVNSSGQKGYFQNEFRVYGRENNNCYKCSDIIQRVKKFGRSYFFCPTCQKVKV